MERERAQKGLIRGGGFGRDSQAPPPVSAMANQRPVVLRRGWDHGGGDQIGGEGRGFRTLELKAAEAGNGH